MPQAITTEQRDTVESVLYHVILDYITLGVSPLAWVCDPRTNSRIDSILDDVHPMKVGPLKFPLRSSVVCFIGSECKYFVEAAIQDESCIEDLVAWCVFHFILRP